LKVRSVWPGGMVELPDYRLEGDQVVLLRSAGGDARTTRVACPTPPLEGLRAVALGLAAAWDRQKAGQR
jgi:hypothetical protein